MANPPTKLKNKKTAAPIAKDTPTSDDECSDDEQNNNNNSINNVTSSLLQSCEEHPESPKLPFGAPNNNNNQGQVARTDHAPINNNSKTNNNNKQGEKKQSGSRRSREENDNDVADEKLTNVESFRARTANARGDMLIANATAKQDKTKKDDSRRRTRSASASLNKKNTNVINNNNVIINDDNDQGEAVRNDHIPIPSNDAKKNKNDDNNNNKEDKKDKKGDEVDYTRLGKSRFSAYIRKNNLFKQMTLPQFFEKYKTPLSELFCTVDLGRIQFKATQLNEDPDENFGPTSCASELTELATWLCRSLAEKATENDGWKNTKITILLHIDGMITETLKAENYPGKYSRDAETSIYRRGDNHSVSTYESITAVIKIMNNIQKSEQNKFPNVTFISTVDYCADLAAATSSSPSPASAVATDAAPKTTAHIVVSQDIDLVMMSGADAVITRSPSCNDANRHLELPAYCIQTVSWKDVCEHLGLHEHYLLLLWIVLGTDYNRDPDSAQSVEDIRTWIVDCVAQIDKIINLREDAPDAQTVFEVLEYCTDKATTIFTDEKEQQQKVKFRFGLYTRVLYHIIFPLVYSRDTRTFIDGTAPKYQTLGVRINKLINDFRKDGANEKQQIFIDSFVLPEPEQEFRQSMNKVDEVENSKGHRLQHINELAKTSSSETVGSLIRKLTEAYWWCQSGLRNTQKKKNRSS